MKIWKFKLEFGDQLVKMPLGSKILDIQMQDGIPVMWALCPVDADEVEVKIYMLGAGWTYFGGTYIATVQDKEGLVWHFFTEK